MRNFEEFFLKYQKNKSIIFKSQDTSRKILYKYSMKPINKLNNIHCKI